MEKVFVDPLTRSRRLERIQTLAFAGIILALLAAIWMKYLISGEGALRGPLVLSSLVAAAFGVGYYMLVHNRLVMKERTWMAVDEHGIRSMTPAGLMEVSWPDVLEVRIAMRPSRGRSPDVLIRTDRGFISAFMRWVDESGEMPEPVLAAAGSRFLMPGGNSFTLAPENSQLVAALKDYLPPEKIEEGVIISL